MLYNKVTNTIIIILLFVLIYKGIQRQGITFLSNKKTCQNHFDQPKPEKTSSIPGYAIVSIDPRRVQLLDIITEKVVVRDLTKIIRTVGIVDVDETRIAHIQTKFSGWIEELYVNFIGMPVKQGQPLFSVYSPDLLATQQEYLIALSALDSTVKGRFSKELQQSNLDILHAAQRRLELWGISPNQISFLEKERISLRTLVFHSLVDGIVLNKTAFIGMNVEPGMTIYTIADLSYIWILADIYEDNISFIQLGQEAKLTLSSLPGKLFDGKVTFVDYVVEPSTRTMKVRFEFENNNFSLKPGMYATTEIQLNMGKALALPEEALINTGKRKIVFVAKGEGHYEPREVQLGFKAGPFYQVLSGISEGELVAISAQFLLDSESRLKALEGRIKGLGIE